MNSAWPNRPRTCFHTGIPIYAQCKTAQKSGRNHAASWFLPLQTVRKVPGGVGGLASPLTLIVSGGFAAGAGFSRLRRVVSRVMRKKVSRQRKKRVVMQWRNRREQPPGASCSCISCCPTECLRHGAGERRRALGRNCRQGRHPRPVCAYGSRG